MRASERARPRKKASDRVAGHSSVNLCGWLRELVPYGLNVSECDLTKQRT